MWYTANEMFLYFLEEGEFSMEGVERYSVKLKPYNPDWEKEFRKAKEELEDSLTEAVIDIQHVGSTAIPSVLAKPVLDIAVLLNQITEREIHNIEKLGYEYRGMPEKDSNYHLFVMRDKRQFSLRHLHCYSRRESGFAYLVAFRDYLNAHETAAKEYEDLKKELSEKFQNDRSAYTKGKSVFIQKIYEKIKGEMINIEKEKK